MRFKPRPRLLSASTVAVIAIATGVILAAPASAAATCDYSGSILRLAQVRLNAPGDVAVIERDGGVIEMNGAPCEEATVNNTSAVTFEEVADPPVDVTAVISLRGGPFAPGYDEEAGASDEIEFLAALDIYTPASTGDQMVVRGGGGSERIRMGKGDLMGTPTRFINLNADEAHGRDWDVRDRSPDPTWDQVRALGGPGRDRLSGEGGADTGAMFDVRLALIGGADADRLTGGSRGDLLKGGSGNDFLIGGPGPDVLKGGPGSDTCRGGPGADTLVSC